MHIISGALPFPRRGDGYHPFESFLVVIQSDDVYAFPCMETLNIFNPVLIWYGNAYEHETWLNYIRVPTLPEKPWKPWILSFWKCLEFAPKMVKTWNFNLKPGKNLKFANSMFQASLFKMSFLFSSLSYLHYQHKHNDSKPNWPWISLLLPGITWKIHGFCVTREVGTLYSVSSPMAFVYVFFHSYWTIQYAI